MKKRDRTVSPDSVDSGGDDSPRATSPLLQPPKGPKIEIRKSCSIGKLQGVPAFSSKNRRDRIRGNEQLMRQNEIGWKRVMVTSNGYSD